MAPGSRLVVREHEVQVPLDHAEPDGEQLTIFARELAAADGLERPFLLFLQGGPGVEAPRTATSDDPAWLERALREFRVLLLDQRGTGRSTPVGALAGRTPDEQAAYLTHFRADSIVRDAELLRGALGSDPWSILGQSFGGFCAVTYLSFAPEGLREALITGGLPPLGLAPDAFYTETFGLVAARAEEHFARHPGDRERLVALQEHVAAHDVRLPGGDRLTADRVRALGHPLGMSSGSDALHHLLELPWDSPAFLHDVAAADGFARNPLYAAVHEACAADGQATRWAAARVQPAPTPDSLTGEHILPSVFAEQGELAPLREAAELLAEHRWPRLYDPERLARSTVPAAALIYADDPYVPRRFSEETAAAIGGLRPWVTSEYLHDGLRADGARVLDRLLGLARGTLDR